MKVVFRVDASLQIGSGHVMRCLTLAEALRALGAQCYFIGRAHSGHLMELIRRRDFAVTTLPSVLPSVLTPVLTKTKASRTQTRAPAHALWLGCDWQTDAEQTRAVAEKLQPDWLVVDHYALDHQWEATLRPHCKNLMVIDDLADRVHQCDVLLDQNLGREPRDYASLVPDLCKVLTGPQYALLRPEFAALRPHSLQRRQQPAIKRLLITMGGVDQTNATGQVLQALNGCALSQDCRITVVMGLQAPWLEQVRAQAHNMQWPTKVLVDIDNMAQRMADSDLAIGAAGGTSWERCCLGLPSVIVVVADNQRQGAQALKLARTALLIEDVRDIAAQLPLLIHVLASHELLREMSTAAAELGNGRGVAKVLLALGVSND